MKGRFFTSTAQLDAILICYTRRSPHQDAETAEKTVGRIQGELERCLVSQGYAQTRRQLAAGFRIEIFVKDTLCHRTPMID